MAMMALFAVGQLGDRATGYWATVVIPGGSPPACASPLGSWDFARVDA
jgi:hypothetical protein